MLPLDIKNKFPKYWKEEHEEGSLNEFEGELFEEQLKKLGPWIKEYEIYQGN